MDNPSEDDFNPGKVSTFKKDQIGNCDDFNLTNETDANSIWMDLSHKGAQIFKNSMKFTQKFCENFKIFGEILNLTKIYFRQ